MLLDAIPKKGLVTMLTEWTISNFKSIAEKTSLDLAPLTLVCGANSSGKSTFIQSILLVTQTLSSPATHRALIFNSEIVKLGYLSDILHNGNDKEPLEIQFELSRDTLPADLSSQVATGDRLPISVTALFRAPRDIDGTTSRMHLSKTTLKVNGRQIELTALEPDTGLSGLLSTFNWQISPALRSDIKAGIFDYVIQMASPDSVSVRSSVSKYGSVAHFLPRARLVQFNAGEEFVRRALQEIANLLGGKIQRAPADLTEIRFDKAHGRDLRRVLAQAIAESQRKKDIRSDMSIQGLATANSLLSRSSGPEEWVQFVLKQVPARVCNALADEIVFHAGKVKLAVDSAEIGVKSVAFHPEFSYAIEEISDFFTHRTKYLGPLRDDPRMIYGLPPIPDSKDVGVKGEYTAAVLERFGTTLEVLCPLPPLSEQAMPRQKSMLLLDAVILWLKHMEMVDSIGTQDRGKMGVELSIQTPGIRRQLDLTNVGVGVSQVLPMLTACLLAPKNGLLLLEQPELHLHPKVQAILGDFFLGIASRGTQCIVETHSDRLINRVRRRIAEAEGESVMQIVRINFVEKHGAVTRLVRVKPNEYGAIPDWPKGFFDEGPDEAQRIIEAANRKRQSKLKQLPGISQK